ncbi:MAG: helix-turn-helix domain-containing protein [Candidatus Dadabacteria bacterium]|nr:helix-turn-helix domain-containing protein [Candidatus Dadabacteria bacterium]
MSDKKQDKTKIVQIWGEILDEGFTSVPNILLRYRSRIGLKPKHVMLIVDIMSYKWDSKYPFPSYSTLAQRSGIEERSVKRITQDLEELGLLVKSPRFDEETGAQVTTVFDFRPLVQKLIEELNKGDDYEEELDFDDENENEIGIGRLTPEDAIPEQKTNKKRTPKGDDRIVRGEGDKNVTRGVTISSPGGVTKMSPEENKYKKKINSIGTLESNLTYVRIKNGVSKTQDKEKERVRKSIRDAIFRKRIFETYDNLVDIKSIEEIVEEGAHRACKDIAVNRVLDIEEKGTTLDPAKIARKVKNSFPYEGIPKNSESRARNFYVGTLCELVAEAAAEFLSEGGQGRRG